MKSHLSLLNTHYEKQLWSEYFSIVDSLYDQHIWRYDYSEEGGFIREDGSRKPPRFVTVIESDADWALIKNRVEEVESLNTKWPIQLLDEVWGWGRVIVGQAQHAQLLKPNETVALLPLVELVKGGVPKAATAIKALEKAGHTGVVEDGVFMVCAGPTGLTLRQGGGRSFVLRGWSPTGEMLHRKLSVGVVVIRGCEKGITESVTMPRKGRKDALVKFGEWESWGFYV